MGKKTYNPNYRLINYRVTCRKEVNIYEYFRYSFNYSSSLMVGRVFYAYRRRSNPFDTGYSRYRIDYAIYGS